MDYIIFEAEIRKFKLRSNNELIISLIRHDKLSKVIVSESNPNFESILNLINNNCGENFMFKVVKNEVIDMRLVKYF